LALQQVIDTLVDGGPDPSVPFCDEVKLGDLAIIRSVFEIEIEKAVDVIESWTHLPRMEIAQAKLAAILPNQRLEK
jgi:hypothetical protein